MTQHLAKHFIDLRRRHRLRRLLRIGRLPVAEKAMLNLAAVGIVMALKEVKEDVLLSLRRGRCTGLKLL